MTRAPRSSLTIEVVGIGKTVPAADFVSAIQHTLAALGEIGGGLSDDARNVEWMISAVSMDSPLRVTLSPAARAGTGYAAAGVVTKALVDAIRTAEGRAAAPPRSVTYEALEHIRLAVSAVGHSVREMAFTAAGRRPVRATSAASAHLEQLIGRPVERRTSIQGRLEMISVHGRPMFNVYEPLRGARVPCYFSADQLLEQASAALSCRRRVMVSGTAKFTRDGKIISMQAERMKVLREREELPQLADLEGIDITGGVNPTEYIRMLRDAE
jgi:hypothetical protein